jgi:serine O-acetyltransferase
MLGVFLFFKGVHAIACARVSHHFWTERGEAGKLIGRLLQSESSDVFGVDIHPGCRLGRGVTIDHATGPRQPTRLDARAIGRRRPLRHALTHTHVASARFEAGVTLGETCVVGDNVYLMHDVTLGATGTSDAHDRHPKVGNGVFLGAKCTVLGNIEIGDGATVAAAALVNKPVPAGYTAVGVPAKLIAPKQKGVDLSLAK